MQLTELTTQADALLGAKDDKKLRHLLLNQRSEDIARLINKLDHGKRKVFAMLPPEVQAEVVMTLTEEAKTFILPRIPDPMIARFLHFSVEDDAADIIQFLPEDRRKTVLEHLRGDKKLRVEKLLRYHPESAGGLMDLNFLTVGPEEEIKKVADRVREYLDQHRQTPLVVVREKSGKVRGFLPYKALMLASPTKSVEDFVHRLPTISHISDQENVLRMASRERADAYGVVDDEDHFLGIIHLRDLLRVAQAEATEDVYRFAGVSTEEEMLGTARAAIKQRSWWLILNLATAFLAASVVSLFQDTIATFAFLAVYMPIVAGMGGNAGTQALAVTVRGLAQGDINRRQTFKLIRKEIATGFVNGLLNGCIVAATVYLINRRVDLALILGSAMIINLIVAGVMGSLIPIILRWFRVDPAVASTVFVTTATDCCGFLAFLGLASYFLS